MKSFIAMWFVPITHLENGRLCLLKKRCLRSVPANSKEKSPELLRHTIVDLISSDKGAMMLKTRAEVFTIQLQAFGPLPPFSKNWRGLAPILREPVHLNKAPGTKDICYRNSWSTQDQEFSPHEHWLGLVA